MLALCDFHLGDGVPNKRPHSRPIFTIYFPISYYSLDSSSLVKIRLQDIGNSYGEFYVSKSITSTYTG